ncbi:MAG TPA: HD domain-containing protein [Gemmataceae bacterium]|nr:HD domain-containing protein [Gemmataceae bacterium]
MNERDFAIEVVRRLREAGYQALWAGGCVRDELLGLVPKDYDVASDARPEVVRQLFPRTVAVGMSFGVVEVLGPRVGERAQTGGSASPLRVQVATFRSDVSYSDGRHPDAVVFSSAREDALRRDFTINGMFFDPIENRLIDYVGGQEDLRNRLLRAIGDPATRFTEDKLRMLRAVRISTRFDLTIEPATASAIRRMASQISTGVSGERIAEELRQLLVYPQRHRGVNLLFDLGLAVAILPEVVSMKGLPQGLPGAPTGDLWDHVLRVLELLGPRPSFSLAFAALLHDVGKPRTMARTPDRYTFYDHEHVGADLARDICDRLKLSGAERERVVWLVKKHQFLCAARQMRTYKLKMTLAHPGIRDLLALHRADAAASGRSTDHVEYCERLLEEWSEADLNPPPLLGGHDLTRRGLVPGPLFKRLLDAVREAQLEGTVKTVAEAQHLVDRLLETGSHQNPTEQQPPPSE